MTSSLASGSVYSSSTGTLNISKAVSSVSSVHVSRQDSSESFSRGRKDGGFARSNTRKRTVEEVSACRSWLRGLEESIQFQSLVVLVIIVDIVVSVFYAFSGTTDGSPPLWFEMAILAILWLDITSRIIAHGQDFFVGDGRFMNIFELCVVIFCSLVSYLEMQSDAVVPTGWLRMLGRVARILRTCVKAHQQKNRLLKAAQRELQMRAFNILQKLLGDLVKVSEHDLILDPLQGSLRLRDAEVQWENLEDLHLPLTVRGGFIGDLQVDVGNVMTASADKEIKVDFRDSVIIFGPIAPDWSTDAVRRRKQRLIDLLSKRLDLLSPILGESHAGEAQMQRRQQDKPMPQTMQGPASPGPSRIGKATRKDKIKDRFLQRLLNQLKVNLSNLSVRYEDINVVQPNPFTCGMALGSLTFGKAELDDGPEMLPQRSTSGRHRKGGQKMKEERTSTSGGSGVTRQQKLEVRQLYVFWDTDGVTSYQGSPEEGRGVDKFRTSRLRERLKLAVVRHLEEKFRHSHSKKSLMRGPMFRERFDEHTYVLFPVTANVTILRRGGRGFEPPSSVDATVSPVQVAIDNRQVESFNRIVTHVHDWIRNSSMSATKPPNGILEIRPQLSDAEHHEHVRWWWSHCVRLLQMKQNMVPAQFSRKFKADLAKPLETEYLNLMIQEHFKDDLKLKLTLFDYDDKRPLDIQVVLPVLTILRLRLSAKRRGPCPGNCGHMVTWHATHCCAECARNPGNHDDTCDRKKVKGNPMLRRCRGCLRVARPTQGEEEVSTMEDDDILLTVDEDEEADASGEDSPTRSRSSRSPPPSPSRRGRGVDSFEVVRTKSGDDGGDVSRSGSIFSMSDVKLHVAIQVDSVEVFVLMYSFWGTLFSCVHFKPPLLVSANSNSRPLVGLSSLGSLGSLGARHPKTNTSAQQSIPNATTGGFGFERFGIPVCPRVPFLTARAEDIRAAVSLPWRADAGWLSDVSADLSVADVRARFSGSALDPMDPSDEGTSILEVKRFDHMGQLFAVTASLATAAATPAVEAGGKVPKGASLKKGNSKLNNVEPRKADSPVGLLALLKSNHWTGRLRAGSVRATCFMPVIDRLLHMVNAGKKPRQVELELALHVKNIRQTTDGPSALDRVLTKIEDYWQGSLNFDCELAQLEVDIYQRYHMNNIMHTTLKLDDCRPRLEFSSQPLQFHVGHLHEVAKATLEAADEVGPSSASTSAVRHQPTWDSVESDAPAGTVDELQTEIQDASIRRYCCGWLHDDRVFDVPRRVSKRLGSSAPPKSQSIGNDPGQRPEGLSVRSWWEPLPWRISVQLVSPTDVGLQVGDASRWPEDFLHLEGQSRHVYGSWFQRDYLHAQLAAMREEDQRQARDSPPNSPRAILASLSPWAASNSIGLGLRSMGRPSALSAGIQSISRRISAAAGSSSASRP